MKTLRIAAVALVVLGTAAFAGVGRPEPAGGAGDEPRGGITVTGIGRVDAVPDTAELSIGVTTKGSTAREALAQNSDRMQRVIAAVKGAGVAATDIRTHDVSVGRDYDARAAGYVASNSVSVRIGDVDKTGSVLEAASAAGANQIYGPSLTRESRYELEQTALERAVEHARRRARTLSRAAGVDLGAVIAMTEATAGSDVVVSERTTLAADVPVEKGTQEITASVTVTFAIE
jgi:uncharacterized protein YggE